MSDAYARTHKLRQQIMANLDSKFDVIDVALDAKLQLELKVAQADVVALNPQSTATVYLNSYA